MPNFNVISGRQSLKSKLLELEKRVGNTPIVKLCLVDNFYAKIEYFQLGNSIKIRPAIYILKKAIEEGKITENTVIIESSSGNFGIALAMICKYLNLKFIVVVDKNTPKQKINVLEVLNAKIILIDEIDETGGYLLNRIRYIENFIKNNSKECFNPNQYENQNNPDSYFYGLAEEIIEDFEQLDAIIVSVSTGGTITGLSKKIKVKFPNINIVAVDVSGSMVFQDIPKKRHLSGLGSSRKSDHVPNAAIDKIEILSEEDIISGCKELLEKELIFAGASSGAAYKAAKKYKLIHPNHSVLIICPDGGLSYMDSVYKIV